MPTDRRPGPPSPRGCRSDPPLTGPQALDFADLAAVTSQLTGRQITRVTVSDDEWKDRLVAQGTPEGYANFALEIFTASRRGIVPSHV